MNKAHEFNIYSDNFTSLFTAALGVSYPTFIESIKKMNIGGTLSLASPEESMALIAHKLSNSDISVELKNC